MAFVFHQICQKEKCDVTYPFRIPLTAFFEGGATLLSDGEKNFLVLFVTTGVPQQLLLLKAFLILKQSNIYV